MPDYTLSEDVAQRLVKMLRWFDRMQGAGDSGGGALMGPGNWQFVRVTGAGVIDAEGPGDTYYPGQVTLRLEPGAEWMDTDAPCWVKGANDETLESGTRYACRQTGNKTLNTDDERACFITYASAAGLPCSDCIEVVTDVDCVDDELIITKKFLRLTPDGLFAFDTTEECDAAEGCD